MDWKELTNRCKLLRRGLGISVEQVAEETGYKVPTIYGFERGSNKNSLILLWYINKGLDIGEFYGKENKETKD